MRVVTLRYLARRRGPMTARQIEQTRAWLDADWESHDALDPDARRLMRRLLDALKDHT